MKLGEKIKLLRTDHELTQPDLAKKAGIEQSYLSKLENDKAIPSFDIINRVAMALESNGLELIDSLSQSFVEENLSHIPEVAAEYAVIKKKRESKLKKRFILASILVIFGIGLAFVGNENILFPEVGYKYLSMGVIKDNEIDQHFHADYIREINESKDELVQRMFENRSRIDEEYKIIFNKDESEFIVKVNGGRRNFSKHEKITVLKVQNKLILIAGIMLIASGVFAFLFTMRFKIK